MRGTIDNQHRPLGQHLELFSLADHGIKLQLPKAKTTTEIRMVKGNVANA